ncbi:hypothetical protein [Lysobacter sp.]|uniref:hypothetical protein n=1 Tax=Lysobacter sp. TaxID=72226 RepID=UPI002D43A7E3|nr:hypothetical protein [Lysobacter sp.]HZX78545.1 hypothetical protein [Lysobacter sp.]
MRPRHILMLMLAILVVAIGAYLYLNSRAAAPLQDPSPDGTSMQVEAPPTPAIS